MASGAVISGEFVRVERVARTVERENTGHDGAVSGEGLLDAGGPRFLARHAAVLGHEGAGAVNTANGGSSMIGTNPPSPPSESLSSRSLSGL